MNRNVFAGSWIRGLRGRGNLLRAGSHVNTYFKKAVMGSGGRPGTGEREGEGVGERKKGQ